jgi:hypothetical protein
LAAASLALNTNSVRSRTVKRKQTDVKLLVATNVSVEDLVLKALSNVSVDQQLRSKSLKFVELQTHQSGAREVQCFVLLNVLFVSVETIGNVSTSVSVNKRDSTRVPAVISSSATLGLYITPVGEIRHLLTKFVDTVPFSLSGNFFGSLTNVRKTSTLFVVNRRKPFFLLTRDTNSYLEVSTNGIVLVVELRMFLEKHLSHSNAGRAV